MQEQVARKNEQAKTWFRSERVYLASIDQWYFRTREGVEIGPYESQFEAEIEAGLLKELLKVHADKDNRMSVIREFVLDAYATGHKLSPVFVEDLPRINSA